MTDTNTPEQNPESNPNRVAHQPFSWLTDDAKNYPMADFVALTMDVCRGVHACLEIVENSVLEQSANPEQDPEDAELPTVSPNDAERLLRLSMAAAWLLREYAEDRIDWINKQGPRHLQSLKEGEK